MKKILLLTVIAAFMVAIALSSCAKENSYSNVPQAKSDEIGVVSFNVAAPWGSLTDNTLSSKRVKLFAKYMTAVNADFIGTQEMNSSWMSELQTLLPQYNSYGVKRGNDENEKKSEMNSVFWLKDKYDCLEKNTFWLSETPDKESKMDGAGCNRICSYVVLQDKDTKNVYIHMNTHLDNSSEDAANYGAGVICKKETKLMAQYPGATIVLTGDFNQSCDGTAYKQIANILYDTRLVAESTEVKKTYTDWGHDDTKGGSPIDYIFSNRNNAVTYKVLDDVSSGYVSDHFGIFASISQ